MGRTLPTIVQTLRAEEESWKDFRRTLRREDQDAFDAIWRFARYHAAAAAMAGRPLPMDAAFMGMLVGLERQLMALESKIAEFQRDRKDDGGNAAGGLAL